MAARRLFVALTLIALGASAARANYREYADLPVDPAIETKLRRVAKETLEKYPAMKAEDLALSVVDVTRATTFSRGDLNGVAPFYPASVIKLFFMAEVFHQRKEREGDMQRALEEMIHVSDNDATAFIVDVISDTCSGSELEERALRKFADRRRVVNRWLEPLGYDVSAMMKPWSYGPYGRDRQLLGPNREHRNRTRANDVAALLLWIVRRRAVSTYASEAMVKLLERPLDPPRQDENQVKEFIGEAVPPGTKLWSKAGWTSEVRHDAAYLELPEGKKLIVVIYTRGLAGDVTLVPFIARKVIGEFTPASP